MSAWTALYGEQNQALQHPAAYPSYDNCDYNDRMVQSLFSAPGISRISLLEPT